MAAAISVRSVTASRARRRHRLRVLAFMSPRLLTTEREFIDRNQFTFRYTPFDWTLNDLTGR